MGKLFSLNDRKLIENDVAYWQRSLSHALELYKQTKVESEDDVEARAVAAAGLAGLGLALHQHFGAGVSDLGMADTPAALSAGLKSYDSAVSHSKSFEGFAEKKLS